MTPHDHALPAGEGSAPGHASTDQIDGRPPAASADTAPAPDTAALLDAAAAKARIAALDAPPSLDLRAHARAASAAGRRTSELLRELGQAMLGPGRLTVGEYFYYRLDDPALDRAELRRFVGKHRQRVFHTRCNDSRWYAAAHDKMLFYAAASGGGLPTPQTLAIYAPGVRSAAAEMLRTPEHLAGFLRRPDCYPLFAKPIEGIYSVGVLSLAAVDGTRIHLTSGEIVDLDAVVRFIVEFGGEGYLLQRRLHPHPMLCRMFGDTLPSLRYFVLLSRERAAIESAVLKIPASRNPADNYWRPGNSLGALDGTGSVTRVITGVGGAMHEVMAHPDTGASLVGFSVPDWDNAIGLCRHAAGMFPGVRTQSWDIALTDAGPVVLEFNFGGDLNLHQLAHRRGALTPSYVDHLRQCGFRRLKV